MVLSFPLVSCPQVLRVFGQIFFQVLDIATMSLLLIAMDCQYFSVPETDKGFLLVRRVAGSKLERLCRSLVCSGRSLPSMQRTHTAPRDRRSTPTSTAGPCLTCCT